jgi:hypothetical protein
MARQVSVANEDLNCNVGDVTMFSLARFIIHCWGKSTGETIIGKDLPKKRSVVPRKKTQGVS